MVNTGNSLIAGNDSRVQRYSRDALRQSPGLPEIYTIDDGLCEDVFDLSVCLLENKERIKKHRGQVILQQYLMGENCSHLTDSHQVLSSVEPWHL